MNAVPFPVSIAGNVPDIAPQVRHVSEKSVTLEVLINGKVVILLQLRHALFKRIALEKSSAGKDVSEVQENHANEKTSPAEVLIKGKDGKFVQSRHALEKFVTFEESLTLNVVKFVKPKNELAIDVNVLLLVISILVNVFVANLINVTLVAGEPVIPALTVMFAEATEIASPAG